MVRTVTDFTVPAQDGLLIGVGLLTIVGGLVLSLTNAASVLFLPAGLLGVLTVAGGALLLVAGLIGEKGENKGLLALWTILVLVSAVVAVVVVLALEVF